MHALIQSLLARGPVVTDGAWGTQLQARGLTVGHCPDEWNLSHPARVAEVACAYVSAGSRVILTNTFGANRVRLAEFGLADKTPEINRLGAQISKRAAGANALVFASVGPTGKMLMAGDITEDELRTAFGEQAAALKAGGADAIVIETMADLEEAKIALAAAKETGLPVVVCLVFDAGAERDRTMMGATLEQVATTLTAAGADAIGANCGNGIAGYIPVCQRMRATTKLPLWFKPNAGLPEMIGGQIVYKTSPAEFAKHVPALRAAGADFIGGCCGTTPAHIAALRASLAKVQ